MFRVDKTQHAHLSSFFEEDVSHELLVLSRRFSIILQTVLILVIGFLLFIPFTQIISGVVVYSLIFIPNSWKKLPYRGKEKVKKSTAFILLAFSNLVINADVVFLIALSAYVSDRTLVLVTLLVGMVCTIIHEYSLRHKIEVKGTAFLPKINPLYIKKFLQFCYIGMMAFQAGFLIVSDVYFQSTFPLTTAQRTLVGCLSEIVVYVLIGLYYGIQYFRSKNKSLTQ